MEYLLAVIAINTAFAAWYLYQLYWLIAEGEWEIKGESDEL